MTSQKTAAKETSEIIACQKYTVFGATMRLPLFSLKQCIIKQLLDSVFVISEIIKVSVSVISLSLQLITKRQKQKYEWGSTGICHFQKF